MRRKVKKSAVAGSQTQDTSDLSHQCSATVGLPPALTTLYIIGVGTTGALGAGAPLHLAILYREHLMEIIAKCVI